MHSFPFLLGLVPSVRVAYLGKVTCVYIIEDIANYRTLQLTILTLYIITSSCVQCSIYCHAVDMCNKPLRKGKVTCYVVVILLYVFIMLKAYKFTRTSFILCNVLFINSTLINL